MQDKVDKDSDIMCTNNYRNSNEHKIILRYVNKELHVYVKSPSTNDYEYCLSVKMGIDTKGYYIALSAMTGQVADRHDVYMLSTRYLDSSDVSSIDDSRLRRAGYKGGRSVSIKGVFFWLLITFMNMFLIYELVSEWWEFDKLKSESLSPVILCQRLNGLIYSAYIVHAIVMLLVVLAGRWTYFLLNTPVCAWRAYQYMIGNIKLEPIKLRKLRNALDVGQATGSLMKGIILIIALIMSIKNIFTG